jgi:hypothetical protein
MSVEMIGYVRYGKDFNKIVWGGLCRKIHDSDKMVPVSVTIGNASAFRPFWDWMIDKAIRIADDPDINEPYNEDEEKYLVYIEKYLVYRVPVDKLHFEYMVLKEKFGKKVKSILDSDPYELYGEELIFYALDRLIHNIDAYIAVDDVWFDNIAYYDFYISY